MCWRMVDKQRVLYWLDGFWSGLNYVAAASGQVAFTSVFASSMLHRTKSPLGGRIIQSGVLGQHL